MAPRREGGREGGEGGEGGERGRARVFTVVRTVSELQLAQQWTPPPKYDARLSLGCSMPLDTSSISEILACVEWRKSPSSPATKRQWGQMRGRDSLSAEMACNQ